MKGLQFELAAPPHKLMTRARLTQSIRHTWRCTSRKPRGRSCPALCLLEVSQTWKMGRGTIEELGRQDDPPAAQHPLTRPLDVHCCWALRSHLRRTHPSAQSGGDWTLPTRRQQQEKIMDKTMRIFKRKDATKQKNLPLSVTAYLNYFKKKKIRQTSYFWRFFF